MSAVLERPLGAELLASGLLTAAQIDALVAHSAAFPALPSNRMFLELRVRDGLALEGYGHGYTSSEFDALIADTSELPPTYAAAIQDILQRDPFRAERGLYLGDRISKDPEWIEYDWGGAAFSTQPAMFFTIPARLRSFRDAARLDRLGGYLAPHLGEDPARADALAVLATLREHTPESMAPHLGIYRMGLSDGRNPGWMKLVLNGIDVDAIRATADAHLGDVLDIFPPVVGLYRQFGGPNQVPIVAGSMDFHHGRVHAIDVECPYFNGMPNANLRRQAARRFVDLLVERGALDAATAECIAANTYRHFASDDQEALVVLNHFKFGIAGATRGRVKLYFEVMTRPRERVRAPARAVDPSRRPRIAGEVQKVAWSDLVDSNLGDTELWRTSCCAGTGRPLHITGVPELERLRAIWTDAHIIEKVGENLVDLDYSHDGVFPGGSAAYDGLERQMLQMPIDEVVRRVHAGGTPKAPASRLYVYGANPRPFARLLEDYAPPMALIGEPVETHTQFWLGGEGTITPAHFDVADNLLGLVRGHKRVLLWDADAYPHLYVNPTGARHERNSRMGSLEDVDPEAWPLFANARALRCELEAGEMLFIPLGWFHYVETTTFTVGVNHFWHSQAMKPFLDAGFFFLRGTVRPELLSLMVHLITERQGRPLRTDAASTPAKATEEESA